MPGTLDYLPHGPTSLCAGATGKYPSHNGVGSNFHPNPLWESATNNNSQCPCDPAHTPGTTGNQLTRVPMTKRNPKTTKIAKILTSEPYSARSFLRVRC